MFRFLLPKLRYVCGPTSDLLIVAIFQALDVPEGTLSGKCEPCQL